MNLLGIDPSLTSTGYCFRGGDDDLEPVWGSIDGSKMTGLGRLVKIEERIVSLIETARPGKVIFEGYAMGIRSGQHRAFDLGELGGVLKRAIWDRGIDLVLVPPSVLKKFITGKGNAKKEEMVAHLKRLSGSTFSNSDEADAYGLLLLGEAMYHQGQKLAGVKEVKGRPIRRI